MELYLYSPYMSSCCGQERLHLLLFTLLHFMRFVEPFLPPSLSAVSHRLSPSPCLGCPFPVSRTILHYPTYSSALKREAVGLSETSATLPHPHGPVNQKPGSVSPRGWLPSWSYSVHARCRIYLVAYVCHFHCPSFHNSQTPCRLTL